MAYTTIDNGKLQFFTHLWTGNAAADPNNSGYTRQIQESGTFRPGMVWVKARDMSGRSHYLYQEAEGYGANKELVPNSSSQEGDTANHNTGANGYVGGTTSTGFSVVSGTSTSNYTNNASTDYVGWTWNGTNSTSNNTDGTITINSSTNSTSKFTMGIYSGNGSAGSTIGHGLGVKPAAIFIKVRNTNDDWAVWHHHDSTSTLRLNSSASNNDAKFSSFFNSTQPSTSVITLGGDAQVNGNGNSYLMFCWAEVKGYSAFGRYTGNASTNGPFCYTGFKPAFVFNKNISASGNWRMNDNQRNPRNVVNLGLNANENVVEFSQNSYDFCSNGFTVRDSAGANNSGEDYVYWAWAEHPFVSSAGVPITAR